MGAGEPRGGGGRGRGHWGARARESGRAPVLDVDVAAREAGEDEREEDHHPREEEELHFLVLRTGSQQMVSVSESRLSGSVPPARSEHGAMPGGYPGYIYTGAGAGAVSERLLVIFKIMVVA